MPKYNKRPDIIEEMARQNKRLRHLERVNQLPFSTVTRSNGTTVSVPELAEGVASSGTIYRGPTSPWQAGDSGHTDDDGDLWWQETTSTDDLGNESLSTHPYLWDSVNLVWVDAADPQLNLIGTNTEAVSNLAQAIENVAETVTSAQSLASTADGRVSMSDYDPTADDVTYFARDRNDTLLKGAPWTVLQASLTNRTATLSIADIEPIPSADSPITVEGVGAAFDGERLITSASTASVGVIEANLIDNHALLYLNAASPWTVGQQVTITGVGSPWDGLVTLDGVVNDAEGHAISYMITAADNASGIPIDPTVGKVSVSEIVFRTPTAGTIARFDTPTGKGYNAIVLPRNEGSVWFTRTRPRRNLVTNPSFETDVSGWGVSNSSLLRVAAATAISGSYAGQITNTASGNAYAFWGGSGLSVSPGQVYSSTVFACVLSGSGADCYASVQFLNSTNDIIADYTGTPVDLVGTEDWRELKITATVPSGATKMVVRWYNNNPSAVWLLDGALIEQAAYTGKYFDGRSYDARWTGTVDSSVSILNGGKVVSVFELYDSGWARLDFTSTTIADTDASDITSGTLNPARIGDHALTIDKLTTNKVVASEVLVQGDLVNIWSNNGLFMARKSDATLGYTAHGYVLASCTTGTAIYVHTDGYNPYCSSLTPGTQYISITPGKSTGTAPAQSGRTVQRVGVASDATTLHFQPGTPIRLT